MTHGRPPGTVAWWRGEDSNLRRRTPTGLQPVPFGHTGTSPRASERAVLGPRSASTPICAQRKHSPHLGPPMTARRQECSDFDLSRPFVFLANARRPKPPRSSHRNGSDSWSWRGDSNLQPADYKSAALPVELRQRATAEYISRRVARQQVACLFVQNPRTGGIDRKFEAQRQPSRSDLARPDLGRPVQQIGSRCRHAQ